MEKRAQRFKESYSQLWKDRDRPNALDFRRNRGVSLLVAREKDHLSRLYDVLMDAPPSSASGIVMKETAEAYGLLTKKQQYCRLLTIRKALNAVRHIRGGVGWENEHAPRHLDLLESIGLDMWCEKNNRMPEPGVRIFNSRN
jgi:hypothetical protein